MSDDYAGRDLSVLASHLFEGHEIVDWTFALVPHSIAWCVRDDGALLGLSYMREHDIRGWSRHDTDGAFESVATLSEGLEDKVYTVVKRTVNGEIKRYIERFESRVFDDVEDAFFVDCGLSIDMTDAPFVINGIDLTDKVTVSAPGHGLEENDHVQLNGIVGEPLTFDEDGELDPTDENYVIVGPGDNKLVKLDLGSLNGHSFIVVRKTDGSFDLQNDQGQDLDGTHFTPYVSGGTGLHTVRTLSGLDHLEGKTVSILADGHVEPQQTVTSGAITLDRPAQSVVHVGLPFVSELETLGVNTTIREGTGQGRRKRIAGVTLRLHRTRGCWVGPADGALTELKMRTDEAWGEPTALFTGDKDIALDPKWGRSGRILVRQTDPLPLTILAVIPEVDHGDQN